MRIADAKINFDRRTACMTDRCDDGLQVARARASESESARLHVVLPASAAMAMAKQRASLAPSLCAALGA
jgi:hypothetical protein